MTTRFLCLIFLFSFLFSVGYAQEADDVGLASNHWQVYLERRVNNAGQDRLVFSNILSGEESEHIVTGERYTLLSDRMIYFDPVQRVMMEVVPQQAPTSFATIVLSSPFRRVDWVVSSDRQWLAWTITTGEATALQTSTSVLRLGTNEIIPLFNDGPRNGVRALPVAFSDDNQILYMDAHPDSIGQFAPYTQYAGLFGIQIETGEIINLPEEPGCFCGGGFGAGLMLRLDLRSDSSGFDVNVTRLENNVTQRIEALRLRNYTQAGDLLITEDGRQAIYALSLIEGFGTTEQSVQTVFMLVNLQTMSQERLNDPITTYIHPIAWTDDNSAVLFTSPQRNGTWKIHMDDGDFIRVAEANYLGDIRQP